jgi:uncharacterized protein (TIGR03382 family)
MSSRFTRVVTAFVLLVAASGASAFTRDTTTRGRPETGLWLWWGPRAVTFRVNAAALEGTQSGCRTAAVAETTIASALATWGAATRTGETASCTDFSFAQAAPITTRVLGNDGVNLIVVRTTRCADAVAATPGACNIAVPGDCASKLNCWEYDISTLGLTTTTFDPATGEIRDADMELFAWNGLAAPRSGAYFTCEPPTVTTSCSDPFSTRPTGCQATDLGAVATHEAGHMLGLGHVCSSEGSPVYAVCPTGDPVMRPNVGAVSARVLAQDDVAGVCTVYPRGAATPKSPPTSSGGDSGGGGCNTAGGAGILALLGAAAAAWRARRRAR